MEEQKEQEEEPEEDYNFDFSQYEDDEEEEIKLQQIESLKKLKRPNVTGLRSRFSMGEKEFERLAEIKMDTMRLSIKVAARTQDLNTLWTYYGTLSEYWETIRNIFGSIVNSEMKQYFDEAAKLLEQASEKGSIPKEIHQSLIKIKSKIYRLVQLSNLGFEVEKVSASQFSKTKRSIVQ